MWAPHIERWSDGSYRLYFSAARRENGEMAIGVATSDSPTGPSPMREARSSPGHSFSAIDPFVFEVDGTPHLYWGSAGEPISAQELSADGLSVTGEVIEVLPRSIGEYEGLIEGAWITEHDGMYYLLYSGDACCGPEAHYAVMAARSDSPLGPFTRDPNNPILAANDEFNAPGHHAVVTGRDGSDWILYHAMVRPETSFRSLFLDRIDWADGWPAINGGDGPSACLADAPHDPPIPRLPVAATDASRRRHRRPMTDAASFRSPPGDAKAAVPESFDTLQIEVVERPNGSPSSTSAGGPRRPKRRMSPTESTPMSELRWNPQLREWVITATHRQDRTFLPGPEKCPLCPTRRAGS